MIILVGANAYSCTSATLRLSGTVDKTNLCVPEVVTNASVPEVVTNASGNCSVCQTG